MAGRTHGERLNGPDIDSASMTDTPQTPADPSMPEPSTVKQSAFDIWLNRGLHQLFDAVVSEPIPDELLKLILDDKNK